MLLFFEIINLTFMLVSFSVFLEILIVAFWHIAEFFFFDFEDVRPNVIRLPIIQ